MDNSNSVLQLIFVDPGSSTSPTPWQTSTSAYPTPTCRPWTRGSLPARTSWTASEVSGRITHKVLSLDDDILFQKLSEMVDVQDSTEPSVTMRDMTSMVQTGSKIRIITWVKVIIILTKIEEEVGEKLHLKYSLKMMVLILGNSTVQSVNHPKPRLQQIKWQHQHLVEIFHHQNQQSI